MKKDDSSFADAKTEAIPALRALPRAAPVFDLLVTEGPDQGARFTVDASLPGRTLVGKSPACALRLTDPLVSRRHAAFELTDRGLRITDLESTNGTSVDGISVVEVYLKGSEIVRMGSTALVVERRSAEAPPQQAATRFGRVIGASEAMRRIYPLCERLAQADVPVIIEGETGTGKEQLAEAIHEQSSRAGGPYVVFDCTTVAPNLIESELFGHERGAFTGATGSRKGVFERAHGGTLLIDEIGDMPLDLQPKLLRALERREILHVGGERPVRVDVRIIAATRRDLDREVQLGRFRDDLFHRLAVARVELPPLRQRKGDVTLLARHFAADMGGSPDALPGDLLRRWEDAPWPGNVRELRNAVARRLALGDLAEAGPSSKPPPSVPPPPGGAPPGAPGSGDPIARVLSLDLPLADARQRLVEEFEARYVEHILAAFRGNVSRAAAAAGVARRHLQRLRAKYAGGAVDEEGGDDQ
jgi:two-component system, NtrC family, response regulator HydG